MTWEDRIQAAEKRGYFTADDKMVAGPNTSCSLGERTEGRFATMEALKQCVGESTYALGYAFTTAVYEDRVARARVLHNLIWAPDFAPTMERHMAATSTEPGSK